MGGQPYLYTAERFDGDSLPNTFNPKAVTMASLAPLPPPKPKPKGPLINFNRHPDSYLILPYGRTGAKPMSPKTKTVVKWARWVQLVFRVFQLLGAIGVLLCGIFIKGTQNSEGFIIRIPPGVDIGASLYAIYHLLRAAGKRPAGSSASYHFFALVLDAGFIPFYVFTALLSNRNYNHPPGTRGRWRTFFPTEEETTTVLHAAWLTATATAGLHIASLFLDLYLVIVFRKITNLPPDMNPLEDNLTSRRKTKHKHKTSSISAMEPLTGDKEKRFSAMTASTTNTGNRGSQAEPLMEKENLDFMHTRTNSDIAYSPHTPNTARHSRNSMYSQPNSARVSRTDLHHRDDLHRTKTKDTETLSQRKMKLAAQAGIKRSSRPNSVYSSKDPSRSPPKPQTDPSDADLADISLQPQILDDLTNNWFVHTGDKDTKYNALPSDDEDEEYKRELTPQPLRMNPPTPPPNTSPVRTKSRYYGDLASATHGIRKNSPSPTKSTPIPHALPPSPSKSLAPTSFASVRRIGEKGYTAVRARSPRVVSRSGVDYDFYDEDSRGRNVSGKVVEEGRGGIEGFEGLRGRRVSGMA